MAETLDNFLRAEETVIYRTPGEHEPFTWSIDFGVVIVVATLAATAGYYLFDLTNFALLAVVGICLALTVKWWAGRVPGPEVAVTDKRVLRLRTAGDSLDYTAVDLADIATIEIWIDDIKLTKVDGEIVVISHPKRSDEIGQVLSGVLEVPKPFTPRSCAQTGAAVVFWILWFGAAVIAKLLFATVKAKVAGTLNAIFASALLVGPAFLLWWCLVAVVAMIVLHLWLRHAELRELVAQTNLFLSRGKEPPDNNPLLPLALDFVDRLYGRRSTRNKDHGG